MNSLPVISVCICTYKRSKLLSKLLDCVALQETDSKFIMAITIVDNDSAQSAKSVVESFKDKHKNHFDIIYDIECEQNISLARNRAVGISTGEFIAFIDDDEFPDTKWLLRMYECYLSYKGVAMGVFGAVLPIFEDDKSVGWKRNLYFYRSKPLKTGSILGWQETRTSSVLLPKSLFDESGERLDPAYGRTGGGDMEFFSRLMLKYGYKFVWCEESVVYEIVEPVRLRFSWLVSRAMRSGRDFAIIVRKHYPNKAFFVFLRASCAFFIFGLMSFLAIFMGRCYWLECILKMFCNFGKILNYFGYKVIWYK